MEDEKEREKILKAMVEVDVVLRECILQTIDEKFDMTGVDGEAAEVLYTLRNFAWHWNDIYEKLKKKTKT